MFSFSCPYVWVAWKISRKQPCCSSWHFLPVQYKDHQSETYRTQMDTDNPLSVFDKMQEAATSIPSALIRTSPKGEVTAEVCLVCLRPWVPSPVCLCALCTPTFSPREGIWSDYSHCGSIPPCRRGCVTPFRSHVHCGVWTPFGSSAEVVL